MLGEITISGRKPCIVGDPLTCVRTHSLILASAGVKITPRPEIFRAWAGGDGGELKTRACVHCVSWCVAVSACTRDRDVLMFAVCRTCTLTFWSEWWSRQHSILHSTCGFGGLGSDLARRGRITQSAPRQPRERSQHSRRAGAPDAGPGRL